MRWALGLVWFVAACGGDSHTPSDASGDGPPGGDALADGVAGDGAGGEACLGSAAFGAWHAVSTTGLPPRVSAMVWTGTEVLVVDWEIDQRLDAYNPSTDTWRSVPIGSGALSKRNSPFVAWANNKLFIWGGYTMPGGNTTIVNDGAVFDPGTGTWTAVATSGAPTLDPSFDYGSIHAFGSGSLVMVLAAGRNSTEIAAVYDVAGAAWTATLPKASGGLLYGCDDPSWDGTTNAACAYTGTVYRHTISPYAFTTLPAPPSPLGGGVLRSIFTAWTSTKLFAWGGNLSINANTTYGATLYDAGSNMWSTLITGGPSARANPVIGALGGKVAIWGGREYSTAASGLAPSYRGAAFDPTTSTWTPISCTGAPMIDQPAYVAIPTGLFISNGTTAAILSP